MPVASIGGSRYVVTMLDDANGFAVTQPFVHKWQVPKLVKQILTMLETASERRVKRVRTDNGTEFETTSWTASARARAFKMIGQ